MKEKFDVLVIGGGLAGISAAVSAARLGCEVALVQDRPVLGGNSSSEIRVPLGGACDFNPWARETGIIEELFNIDRAKNHKGVWAGLATSVWDLILYEAIKNEKRISLFLNTSARDVILSNNVDKKIRRIKCYQNGTEKEFNLEADIFIDATGDGTIAFKAGSETRMGRESRKEFNESLAPNKEDGYTQGSSLMFHTIDVGTKVPFDPPEWIPVYKTDDNLYYRTHEDLKSGYWWIEVGCPPYNTITDNDKIYHELLRQLLGVWNHIKNYGNHNAENLVLDWVGSTPGKRESRRIIGDYILTENDLKESKLFSDRVAYGGWFIDIHTPGGILVNNEPPEATFRGSDKETEKKHVCVYSIPFRSLYSKDIRNLMMAGRQISVTHVALGSTRLMGTCAIIGQAVGTAAYLCKKYGISPRELYKKYVKELQQLLLKQDCYIPGIKNEDPKDLVKKAKVKASSSSVLKFGEGKLGVVYEPPRQRYISVSNLERERAQLFPVTANNIDYVELLLESQIKKQAEVVLSLRKANNIWDFSSTENIKTIKAVLPPGKISWVRFNIEQKVEPNSFYWITVKAEKDIFWRYCENSMTGVVAGSKIIKKWALFKGCYSMRIFPDSSPYNPENIINGVARPEKWTNIWISDPERGFPQNIELDFGKEKKFNSIYLIFDTGLSRSHVLTPQLFKAPECVKDYSIFYEHEGRWKKLLEINNNFYRRRIHHFDDISSKKLKIEVFSTNGDRSARIYEIRVYQESDL